jgi:hypothetical protein
MFDGADLHGAFIDFSGGFSRNARIDRRSRGTFFSDRGVSFGYIDESKKNAARRAKMAAGIALL